MRLTSSLRLFPLALVLFLAACPKPAVPPGEPPPETPPASQGAGEVRGRVFDSKALTALAGVTVKAGTVTATTDANGNFTLLSVAVEQLTLQADKAGFAPQSAPLSVLADQQVDKNLYLSPVTATATFDVAKGGAALDALSGARAVFAKNSIVDSNGVPVTGNVNLALAPLDPTVPGNLAAFPGQFEGKRTDGTTSSIETFGPMSITVGQAGSKLNLAAGAKAVVYFPITRDDAPFTIPLWSLNETSGEWVEEGTAYRTKDDQGRDVYRAEVSHLSYWNPDSPIERSCIRVCARTAGAPLPYASVELTGVGYGFRSYGNGGADGCVNLRARKNYQASIVAYRGLVASVPVTAGATGPEGATCEQVVTVDVETGNGACPPGALPCGTSCRLVRSDSANCGACGTTCGDGKACVDGVCACPMGRTACGSLCTDPQTDVQNCGACNTTCSASQVCVAGACMTPNCGAGLSRCGATCVDAQTDRLNCGGCSANSTYPTCSVGQCAMCGGVVCARADGGMSDCTQPSLDNDNCGACGTQCSPNQKCTSGVCVALACGTGTVPCGHKCLSGDSCGTACGAGLGCEHGVCAAIVCGAGQTLCGNDCVDTTTNSAHCGVCGNACGASQTCQASVCSCQAGFSLCDSPTIWNDGGTPAPKVCTDTQTQRDNCGACGNKCAIGKQCTAGACVAIVCPTGQERCGNGCITPLTDPANCGGCTFGAGASGELVTTCPTGSCSCTGSTTECPLTGTPGTSYCADPSTDRAHCGACGNACAVGQTCTAGTCVAITCPAGSQLCGSSCVYGTSCGLGCNVSAGQSCVAGACQCAGTTPAICSGTCVDLNSSSTNCGACGTTCSMGQSCVSGTCQLAPCPSGQYRCFGTCIDPQTSMSHCGGCSPGATMGPPTCATGTCACASPKIECAFPGNLTLATCVDTQTNGANCGGCGSVDAGFNCGVNSYCSGGACQPIICPSGKTLCYGSCVDTPACGVSCYSPKTCSGGVCI